MAVRDDHLIRRHPLLWYLVLALTSRPLIANFWFDGGVLLIEISLWSWLRCNRVLRR